MYLPAAFAEDRPEALFALVRAHPLGTLVTHGPAGLDADALPFELETPAQGPARLLAHVARANPVWQGVPPQGLPVLVVFHGPQAYVSPNGYPSKHRDHRQVPTWNYQRVHAHGRLRVREDARFLLALLGHLTRTHEQRNGEARPWRMSDAPPDYLAGLLDAIVGLEIEVERWEGKFKLGQNKALEDRLGAIAHLEARGPSDLAQAMRDALPRDADA